MEEERTYTKEELVNFGYYILSEQRTLLIKNNSRGNHKDKVRAIRQVYDADIANFEFLYEQHKLSLKPAEPVTE